MRLTLSDDEGTVLDSIQITREEWHEAQFGNLINAATIIWNLSPCEEQ